VIDSRHVILILPPKSRHDPRFHHRRRTRDANLRHSAQLGRVFFRETTAVSTTYKTAPEAAKIC